MKPTSIFVISAISAAASVQQLSLEDVLRSAWASRPALESASLRLSQARLTSRSLGAYPASRLSVGYTTPIETGGSDDDLVLSQPLDLFGRTAAMRRSGNALIAQAEAEYRRVALDVQSETIGAYLDALTAVELLRSSQALQGVYERLHEATRLRVEGGVAPGFHLTQVSLDLDQARLRTEQRQAESKSANEKLKALTGLTDNLDLPQGFPAINPIGPDEARLRQQLPQLILLEADILLAEAEAGIAKVGRGPELELQARRTPWQERDNRLGLRIQLSIPLFDHGRGRAEARAAETRTAAARKALEDATKLAKGELTAARVELESAKSQVAKYEVLVAKAKELVERLRPGLTEQATTIIEVLDSTRVLRDLEQAFVEARSRLAFAEARFLKASGQLLEVKP